MVVNTYDFLDIVVAEKMEIFVDLSKNICS